MTKALRKFMPPYLDQHLGFGKAVEDFAVKQLITQAAVEGFTIAISPSATRCDVKRLNSDLSQPVFHGACIDVNGGLFMQWAAARDAAICDNQRHRQRGKCRSLFRSAVQRFGGEQSQTEAVWLTKFGIPNQIMMLQSMGAAGVMPLLFRLTFRFNAGHATF